MDIKSYEPIIKSKKPLFRRKQWFWVIVASNGRTIGRSTETYYNLQDCIYNLKSVGASASGDYTVEHE